MTVYSSYVHLNVWMHWETMDESFGRNLQQDFHQVCLQFLYGYGIFPYIDNLRTRNVV